MANSTIKKELKSKLLIFTWTPSAAGALHEINVAHGISPASITENIQHIKSVTPMSGSSNAIATIKTIGITNVVVQIHQISSITSSSVEGYVLVQYE